MKWVAEAAESMNLMNVRGRRTGGRLALRVSDYYDQTLDFLCLKTVCKDYHHLLLKYTTGPVVFRRTVFPGGRWRYIILSLKWLILAFARKCHRRKSFAITVWSVIGKVRRGRDATSEKARGNNSLTPNVAAEWITLLLCIRDVLGSNLDPETGYHDWGISCFSSVSPGKCRDSTLKLGCNRFLPHSFQFTIHLPPYYSTLYSLRCWESVAK
jgi:hypothetical protein